MINDLGCAVCPDLANESKEVIKRFGIRPIDEGFDVEMCYMAIRNRQCIDDFRRRPEPTCPPEFIKYMTLVKKDKQIFRDQNPMFFVQGKVAYYIDERDRINDFNNRNKETMIGWLRLAGISLEARKLVEQSLDTHSGPNKKIIAPNEYPKDINDILESAGGSLV